MFETYCYFSERVIILQSGILIMGKQERTMPICLTPEELNLLELYARKRGMLNAAQAIEELLAK
jgi:hypothetical protein